MGGGGSLRAWRTAGGARYLAKGCSKCSASRRRPPSRLSSTSPVAFVHNTCPPSGPTQRLAMVSSASATRSAAVTDPGDWAMDPGAPANRFCHTEGGRSGPPEGGNGRGGEEAGSAAGQLAWIGHCLSGGRAPGTLQWSGVEPAGRGAETAGAPGHAP